MAKPIQYCKVKNKIKKEKKTGKKIIFFCNENQNIC